MRGARRPGIERRRRRQGRTAGDENVCGPAAAGRHCAGVVRPVVRRGRAGGPGDVYSGGPHNGGGARGHGHHHAQRPRPRRDQRDGDDDVRESGGGGGACPVGGGGRARVDRIGARRAADRPVEPVRDRRHEAAGDGAVRGQGEDRRDGHLFGGDDDGCCCGFFGRRRVSVWYDEMYMVTAVKLILDGEIAPNVYKPFCRKEPYLIFP